mgnify:FL=1
MLYKPLSKSDIGQIVDLMLKGLSKRLEDRQLSVTVSDAAKNYIIDEGYDPVFGARPLKRFIQSKVETLIARKIIADDIEPYSTLCVDFADGALNVTVKKSENAE